MARSANHGSGNLTLMSRPAEITRPYRTHDGTVITLGDAILDHIEAGNYIETAAHAVGMAKNTLHATLDRGARAIRLSTETGKPIPAKERAYAEFVERYRCASARSEAIAVAVLTKLSLGEYRTKRTTVTVAPDGKETVQTTVEEHLPNVRALQWRLERRWAKRWGQAGSLEETTADDAPTRTEVEMADSIERSMEAYLEGVKDGRAEAEAQW